MGGVVIFLQYILYKLKMMSAKSDSKHVLYFGGIKASSTPAQKQRRINHFANGKWES